MFGKRTKPAPLGAAVPDAHVGTALPAGAPQVLGDEMPDQVNYAPRTARSFRGRMEFGAPSGPATDTPDAQLRAQHIGPGSPDPRHVWDAADPAGSNFTQQPYAVAIDARPAAPVQEAQQAAPTRNRAGSTGEDQARPSTFAAYTFQRPFDQNAEYGPAAIDKLPMISPLAAHPIQDSATVPGALPHASGTTASGMEAAGVKPNTFRTIPGAWDEQLVDNGGAAATRSWRLR